MQASIVFSILALTFASLVQAQNNTVPYLPFVVLNDGVVDSGKNCDVNEWAHVRAELALAYFTPPRDRRRLGAAATAIGAATAACATHTPNNHESSRDLQLINCNGKLTAMIGRCAARRAAGRRRDLQTSTTTSSVSASVCDKNIVKFNGVLDRLKTDPKLSRSCQAYVGSSRKYECRQAVECDINGFALWNADSDKIHTPRLNATGTKICASFKINFEALVNFHVGNINYVVQGHTVDGAYHITQHEWEAPYYAFGNMGSDVYSEPLPVGTYTLYAVSELAPTKGKKIAFEVIGGC